jgi:hypothetical protein
MRVQDGAGSTFEHDADVQRTFIGALLDLLVLSLFVNQQNLIRAQRSLSTPPGLIASRNGSRLTTALKFPLVPSTQPRIEVLLISANGPIPWKTLVVSPLPQV